MTARSSSSRRAAAVVLGALMLLLLVLPGMPLTRAAGAPLRYLGGPAKSLDPAFISDAGDVQLMLQLYAGLSRLDENGDAYPSLARDWDISDDARTYTFHLRDGLTFSDGTPLRAADIRRSWLRLLDPATHTSAPDVLSIVTGARERLAGGPADGVGISAPDDSTLVVHLRQPAGYFPSIVATPATFVVPPSADAGDDWQSATAFVGSGPYRLDGRDGDGLVLRANDRYVAGPPPIAEVRWVAKVDDDPVTAFSKDLLDLAPVSSADAGWLAYDPQLGRRLHQSAALSVQYLGFDTTRPPFDDARVRRAFSLALDRPRLVQLSLGTAALPAGSVVPPALQPDGSALRQAPPSADVAEARRLLAEAGYADPSKLGTITVNASALDVEPIVSTWRTELGVAVNVETMSFEDYLPALEQHPPQVFTINWIADYPSPHALYALLLASDAASNYGHWADERFDQLLDAAGAAESEATQASAYAAVEERADDKAPLIPWSYDAGWWLARDGLTGLGNLTVGLLDFGRVAWRP